ncbi:MAG TPA: preprotein translocase subunit SecG [Pyrinomonadaceae bacterium]|nr:preprotein translocase subunit SecG [Pyrinomonadaceae bacterium]
MLIYFLYGLFILSCIVLVVAVLLQPGKANAGALFSSGISSAAFGPRGTQTLLAKITIGAAVVFMLVALSLSLPALTGQRSVLETQPEETEPASQQPSPAATTAPAETASPAAQPGAQEGVTITTETPASSPNPQASPTK